MTTAKCYICEREMHDHNEPGPEDLIDCGGDCLRCMAEAYDPDCMDHMAKLEPDNPRWRSE